MESLYRVWGARMKAARVARGLTGRNVADHMNVDTSVVFRWEAGAFAPRDELRPLLADLLGVHPDELFSFANGDDDERVPA